MLSENIKAIRKSKGLSQQELAIKLNVVRQTVSKWEQGRSVPDSDLLIALSDVLETPVSTLLGEPVIEPEADAIKAVSEKLEVVNLQLARRTAMGRNALHWAFILAGAVVVMVFVVLVGLGSPYADWDYGDPETAVFGATFHAFEWLFVRLAPIALAGALGGAILTRKKA